MKKWILILLIAFNGALSFAMERDTIKVSCNFVDKPYPEVINYLEEYYNLYFYCDVSLLDDVKITFQCRNLPLDGFMRATLKETNLSYTLRYANTIFILPQNLLLNQLPNYNLDRTDSASVHTKVTEKKYLQGRDPGIAKTIVIGKRKSFYSAQKVSVTGSILEQETNEPLLGATMYIKELKSGVASDENGLVSIKINPGRYTVVFQSLGMTDLKCLMDVRSNGNFFVKMTTERTSIEEVTIKADVRKDRGAIVGFERISLKEVKEMPTLLGEKDFLKISQLLPGVVSVNDGSAGVNVRGGGADQNIFYINKMPVYNTSHVFGFFSAINSTIINDFTIYKAHVPASYGGRLASIFDIETRKGNDKKFFMQGGVSPISANIEVEMPLIKEQSALMLSARSSYSDWILNRLNDPALRNSSAAFSDFAASLNFELGESDNIEFFGYKSSDFFSLNQLIDNSYSNVGGAINYKHWFSKRLNSELSVVASNYSFSTEERGVSAEAYSHSYKLEHYEIREDMTWNKFTKHTINWGLNAIFYKLNRGIVEPYEAASLILKNDLGKEKAVETAIYFDDKYSVNPWLNLYAGIRFSSFSLLGPNKVYTYSSGKPSDERLINDTLTFGNNKKIIRYSNPEIRLALDFKIQSSNSIKLSYVEMNQYMFMLSNTISIAPADQWKLVDYHIQPPNSKQLALGYYKTLNSIGSSFSSEIYYKKGRNSVEYKDGVSFTSGTPIETSVLQGNQNAYGMEFMFSKSKGSVNGWLSYVYSRSILKVNGKQNEDKINGGEEYPSNYDKPHVLNFVGNWKINRRLIFSSNITYSTGRPVTMPKSIYYLKGNPYVEYSRRNEFRIPNYFRLDLSMTIEGNLKVRKALHSSWMLSVYNVTGRNNVNSIYFISDEGQLKGYQYSIIGAPIYTFSWIFKLGNYAND